MAGCSNETYMSVQGAYIVIFLTIGTQLPFDRLVRDVDRVSSQLDEAIVGQIGNGRYTPKRIEASAFMSPDQFEQCIAASRVVVSHAGIGTILTCLRLKKPLIAMARQAKLGEHRNDHQSATMAELASMNGLYPARDSDEILKYLRQDSLAPLENTYSAELKRLRDFVRSEIFGSQP